MRTTCTEMDDSVTGGCEWWGRNFKFFFCDGLQLLADKKKKNSICQGSTQITQLKPLYGIGSDRKYKSMTDFSCIMKDFVPFKVRWKLTGETKHSVVDWMKDNARLVFILVTTDMLVIVQNAHEHCLGSIYFTNIDYTNYTLLIMQ